MAAYAALLSLMQLIHDIENHHSPPISLDKQQLQSLTENATFLLGFLESYASPFADVDDEADPLEIRIADAAYAAEDVIESYIADLIKLSRSTRGEETKSTFGEENDDSGEGNDDSGEENKDSGEENDYSGEENDDSGEGNDDSGDENDDSGEEVKCREELSCINLYEDLHQVIEEMDLINKVAVKIHAEKVPTSSSASSSLSSSASSFLSSSASTSMVCSDDVLNGIMEKLVGGWPDRDAIPITGMGGIGKTTLARNLYAQPYIQGFLYIQQTTTTSCRKLPLPAANTAVTVALPVFKFKLSPTIELSGGAVAAGAAILFILGFVVGRFTKRPPPPP